MNLRHEQFGIDLDSALGAMLFRSTKLIRMGVAAVAGAALVALMVALSFDALSRYLVGRPSQWVPSISSDLLLPIITIMPMLLAALGSDHVRMGFVFDKLPGRAQLAIERMGHVCAAVFWVLVAWTIGTRSLERFGRTSITGSEVPDYITLALIAVGALLMAYVSLVLAVFRHSPQHVASHEQPLEV